MIGYLGPKASFTHAVVKEFFTNENVKPLESIPACMDEVMEDSIRLAVVPLENALEGSVNITLDYLIHDAPCKIVGELVLPIHQHLMIHPRYEHEDLQNIQCVFSHPHAIGQCHHFLHNELNRVKVAQKESTSAAAKFVSENEPTFYAAIANELAAEVYNLKIVKRNIHSYDNNHTRFIILSKQAEHTPTFGIKEDGVKTTLLISLPSDQAGALHQVLSAFAWRKLNLSKIESRPMKTGLGNYFFIIDIEQKMDNILIPGAIMELEALGCTVDVLGSYPYYYMNSTIKGDR